MKIKSRYLLKKNLTNFFGGLGYIICCLGWLITATVYSGFIKDTLLPIVAPTHPSEQPVAPVSQGASADANIFAVIALFAITALMIALAVYVFIKIPKTIVKTGEKVVRQTAVTAAPIVMRIRHVEDPELHPKKLKKMTGLLMLIVKILILVVPFGLVLASQSVGQKTIEYNIAIMMSAWLSGFTAVSFLVQYVLAKLLSVKQQDIL